MNKELARKIGLGGYVDRTEEGKCALPNCGKVIHPNTEFRDSGSRKEFSISGMCQACQDAMFGYRCRACGKEVIGPKNVDIEIKERCHKTGLCAECCVKE